MIDMHCHIDLYSNPHEVAKQCKSRKTYVLSVTTTPKAWYGTYELTKDNSRIQTSLGLHPQLAHERFDELALFDTLLPQAKYVGEIGLDGGKSFRKHREIQIKVFKHILTSLSGVGGRTMSIHSYGSVNTTLSMLRDFPDAGIPILHWFLGSFSELADAIELGSWFTVNPAMLNTKRGRNLVALMPKNRILPETDGPFAKYKNQILMPWQSKYVYQQIAQLWKMNPENVKDSMLENFKDLVRLSAL